MPKSITKTEHTTASQDLLNFSLATLSVNNFQPSSIEKAPLFSFKFIYLRERESEQEREK